MYGRAQWQWAKGLGYHVVLRGRTGAMILTLNPRLQPQNSATPAVIVLVLVWTGYTKHMTAGVARVLMSSGDAWAGYYSRARSTRLPLRGYSVQRGYGSLCLARARLPFGRTRGAQRMACVTHLQAPRRRQLASQKASRRPATCIVLTRKSGGAHENSHTHMAGVCVGCDGWLVTRACCFPAWWSSAAWCRRRALRPSPPMLWACKRCGCITTACSSKSRAMCASNGSRRL